MGAPERLDDRLRQRVLHNLAPFRPERFVPTRAAFERVRFVQPELAKAAVALVLVAGPLGEPAFLLTRRAARLNAHGGQFALPGGRIDQGEDANTAALRELAEELGVVLGPESVLGQLDDFATRSG